MSGVSISMPGGKGYPYHVNDSLFRLLFAVVLLCFAIFVVLSVRIYGTTNKQVTLLLNGKQNVVLTKQIKVRELLAENGIVLKKEDELSVPIDSDIVNGGQVAIDLAKPFVLSDEGNTVELVSTENTVQGALSQQGVQLGENDVITPSPSTNLNVGDSITIERAKPAEEEKVETSTENEVTPDPSVTKNGISFIPQQIINNVTLTAYTAGFASTGKTADSPGYGKTASGTKVMEGRTIAVDPKLIPLGWWVYIEGIGFRRAEDTGSAIKGSKVDVFFESESYAKRFGKKYGYTVYLIGPNKPSGV